MRSVDVSPQKIATKPTLPLPPVGGESTDVDGLLVVDDLKAQRSRAEIEYLDEARHAAGDDLLAVVGEGDAEHNLVMQVVEYEAL